MRNINNKAKVRRSTKVGILGTARVMSYEDLETARAEHATKEAAKESKKAEKEAAKEAKKAASAALEAEEATTGNKKGGQERKSAALVVNAPEPRPSWCG